MYCACACEWVCTHAHNIMCTCNIICVCTHKTVYTVNRYNHVQIHSTISFFLQLDVCLPLQSSLLHPACLVGRGAHRWPCWAAWHVLPRTHPPHTYQRCPPESSAKKMKKKKESKLHPFTITDRYRDSWIMSIKGGVLVSGVILYLYTTFIYSWDSRQSPHQRERWLYFRASVVWISG